MDSGGTDAERVYGSCRRNANRQPIVDRQLSGYTRDKCVCMLLYIYQTKTWPHLGEATQFA